MFYTILVLYNFFQFIHCPLLYVEEKVCSKTDNRNLSFCNYLINGRWSNCLNVNCLNIDFEPGFHVRKTFFVTRLKAPTTKCYRCSVLNAFQIVFMLRYHLFRVFCTQLPNNWFSEFSPCNFLCMCYMHRLAFIRAQILTDLHSFVP